MYKLPREILLLITEYLEFSDLRSLKNTCAKFRDLLRNSEFWRNIDYKFNPGIMLKDFNLKSLDEFDRNLFVNFTKNRKYLNIAELYDEQINMCKLIKLNDYRHIISFAEKLRSNNILKFAYFDASDKSIINFYIYKNKNLVYFQIEVQCVIRVKTESYIDFVQLTNKNIDKFILLLINVSEQLDITYENLLDFIVKLHDSFTKISVDFMSLAKNKKYYYKLINKFIYVSKKNYISV
jgi:hypothetical protein